MLTYKSYYNIALTSLWKLISRRESSVNTRLGTDHHQLIMPPISKDCSNTFLERSFIYAASCEWNKLSEHIRTSILIVSGRVFTQCYLHNNMDADCKQQCMYCSYDCYVGFDHCSFVLLNRNSTQNSYLYASMYIGYLTLNKDYYYKIQFFIIILDLHILIA